MRFRAVLNAMNGARDAATNGCANGCAKQWTHHAAGGHDAKCDHRSKGRAPASTGTDAFRRRGRHIVTVRDAHDSFR